MSLGPGREYIRSHCLGQAWPSFLGQVQLGEPFIIETERFNSANGPIAIAGIKAANPIVATALDIRNCTLYGLGNYIQKGGKTVRPDRDIAGLVCLAHQPRPVS